ncbi:hypothetical protein HanXRQr2_Chr09g0376091 [Helianthus annuus]|uniref:Uncharacterized protein n=1 Tax=Helianthus annuus TaxID=4232 RepID=A0A9K3I3Z5_HELAN|nr:hypothetical protein HanXRQr2_Chr09g0376091 [Helianthus annuus]KAJ0959212.1 hypothetical protein HanPSC8_Chr00c310g0807531 [Helianthus annuus]
MHIAAKISFDLFMPRCSVFVQFLCCYLQSYDLPHLCPSCLVLC